MRRALTLLGALAPAPALAASGPFFSLNNTDFVVTIAFVGFIALIIYVKAPAKIAELLDKRAESIKSEIDESEEIRKEAEKILREAETLEAEAKEQAERIIQTAKEEAAAAEEEAKEQLKVSVNRRLQAAQEQIESAESAAEESIRHQAISIAVSVSRDIIGRKLSKADQSGRIDKTVKILERKMR